MRALNMRGLFGAVLTGMAVLGAGTVRAETAATPDDGEKDQAVMCSKCETVWVRRADRIGSKGPVVYRKEKQMECPDCQSAIVTFFKTGKLEHTCKTCGGALNHCSVHEEAAAPAVASASEAAAQVPEVATEADKAVMCAKCETVWVRRLQKGSFEKSRAVVYRNEKVMQCPDCKSGMANFFTTGKWQHTCNTCGDKLTECAACD